MQHPTGEKQHQRNTLHHPFPPIPWLCWLSRRHLCHLLAGCLAQNLLKEKRTEVCRIKCFCRSDQWMQLFIYIYVYIYNMSAIYRCLFTHHAYVKCILECCIKEHMIHWLSAMVYQSETWTHGRMENIYMLVIPWNFQPQMHTNQVILNSCLSKHECCLHFKKCWWRWNGFWEEVDSCSPIPHAVLIKSHNTKWYQ